MNALARLPWLEQKKIAAWTACRPLDGFSPAVYRVDDYGNLLVWSDHGKQSEYGWEIDHRTPSAAGGSDSLDNLRALYWRVNRQLGGLLGSFLNQNGLLGAAAATGQVNALARKL
jgi:hypothetical protein